MTWAGSILLLGLLLPATVFGPGWIVVRRLRWDPAEKIAAAVGLSLFGIYLFSFAIGVLEVPPAWHWLGSAAFFPATLVALPEVVRVAAKRRQVRVLFLVQLGLIVWSLAALCLIRHYAGGEWQFDWLHQYRKTQVWLETRPAFRDPEVVRDLVIDRPPMMNLIAAHFLAQAGGGFEVFQLVSTTLNALVMLPCFLMAREMAAGRRNRRRRAALILLVLMMVNPMFVQNATYSWQKLFAAFYSILGIAFYLRALRKGTTSRTIAAFVFLAVGCLVHYVAIPYAAMVGGHYLLRGFWRRAKPRRWRELAIVALGAGAILGSWFLWVFVRFGTAAAMQANSTLRRARPETVGEFFRRWSRNLVYSLIPPPLRGSNGNIRQEDWRGFVRDYVFALYQHNWLLAMGAVGGVVIFVLAVRRLRSQKPAPARLRYTAMALAIGAVLALSHVGPARNIVFDVFPTMLLYGVMLLCVAFATDFLLDVLRDPQSGNNGLLGFWRAMLILLPPLAIGTTDCTEEAGLAHVYFQPLILSGLVLLAVSFMDLKRWMQWMVLVGIGVDYALGVALQLGLEHRVFHYGPGLWGPRTLQTDGLLLQAALNWQDKQQAGLTFVGDHAATWATGIEIAMGLIVLIALFWLGQRSNRALVANPNRLGSGHRLPAMPAIN